MKNVLVIALLSLFVQTGSWAQEEVKSDENSVKTEEPEVKKEKKEKSNEYQTLFGGNDKAFGGYFGLNSHYCRINGQDALLIGGELNALINHSFALGFKGYGMVTPTLSNRDLATGEDLYLALGYGGLNLEPILFYNSVIHLSFPILLGAGGVTEYSRSAHHDYHYHYHLHDYSYDYFFVVEPGVNLELNVLKFMRVSTGVSYRATSQIDFVGIQGNDLNGVNFDLSLKFGWF